ncbi:MAG: hypothetical protein EXS08_13270 [Planctomycetes bacterium]|nr:hypothetical protein [Planctomycetota bacterium]
MQTFVVLFHARRSLSVPEGQEWQERFLLETLRREALPFVSSRRVLNADMQRTGAEPASYFYSDGAGANHYTAAANAIVFAALRDGLEGRFEGEER